MTIATIWHPLERINNSHVAEREPTRIINRFTGTDIDIRNTGIVPVRNTDIIYIYFGYIVLFKCAAKYTAETPPY